MIHTYDYPELATFALLAARRYAGLAHALYMPSQVFTWFGLWGKEFHGLDYLFYTYLQKSENRFA